MAKSKQTKRHKRSKAKIAKGVKKAAPATMKRGRLVDGYMPKYLSEPDIPTRRAALWLLKDIRALGDRQTDRTALWGSVQEAMSRRLVEDFESKNEARIKRAYKTSLEVQEQVLRARAHDLRYAAHLVDAATSRELGQLQAAASAESGAEVTLETVIRVQSLMEELKGRHP